jgi:hypothetical protein
VLIAQFLIMRAKQHVDVASQRASSAVSQTQIRPLPTFTVCQPMLMDYPEYLE